MTEIEEPVVRPTFPMTGLRHPTYVQGLGWFALQSVGSTVYTHGIKAYFHADTEPESRRWPMEFCCDISDTWKIEWKPGLWHLAGRLTIRPGEWNDLFSSAEQAAALSVLSSMHTFDQNHFLFHIHDRAAMELRALEFLVDYPGRSRLAPTRHRLRLDERSPRLKRIDQVCHAWSTDPKTCPDGLFSMIARVLDGAEPPAIPSSSIPF